MEGRKPCFQCGIVQINRFWLRNPYIYTNILLGYLINIDGISYLG